MVSRELKLRNKIRWQVLFSVDFIFILLKPGGASIFQDSIAICKVTSMASKSKNKFWFLPFSSDAIFHLEIRIKKIKWNWNEISKINAPNATACKKIKWRDLLLCGVFVFFQNCTCIYREMQFDHFFSPQGIIKTKLRLSFSSFIYLYICKPIFKIEVIYISQPVEEISRVSIRSQNQHSNFVFFAES